MAKIKDINLKSDNGIKSVTVNLEDDPNQRASSPVAKYSINAEIKRLPLIGNKDQIQGVVHVSIKLVENEQTKKLELNEGRQLLMLEHDEDTNTNLTFNMKSPSESVQVVLQPSAILDYEQVQGRDGNRLEIEYEISWSKDNDSQTKTTQGKTIIFFSPMTPKPEIREVEPIEILYSGEKTNEGRYKISFANSCELHRVPWINMKLIRFSLQRDNRDIDDAVRLIREEAAPNVSYLPSEWANIYPDNVGNQEYMTEDYRIGPLFGHPSYGIQVPLEFDLSKIPNPIGEYDDYNLYCVYNYGYDSCETYQGVCRDIKVRVKRNDMRTELGVEYGVVIGNAYSREDVIHDVSNGDNKVNKVEPLLLNVNQDNQGTVYKYKILVKNEATVPQTNCPNAAVVVKNFKIKDPQLEDDGCAFDADGNKISLSSFCSISMSEWLKSTKEVRLTHKTCGAVDVTIGLVDCSMPVKYFTNRNGEKIHRIDTLIEFEFDYLEDREGTGNGNYSHFKGVLVFPLSVPPVEEWLGLDFGTSAVVALYGNEHDDQGNDVDCIVNLETIKRNGLFRAYPGEGDDEKRKVTDENVFINSNIVVNYNTENKEDRITRFEDYTTAKIMFSPGDQIDYQYLLPSLKSMMGYKYIPKTRKNSINNRYEFLRDDVSDVNDVYEMAYHQLFSLYLSNIAQEHDIEKIVMTYPNTFAPMHVQKLKEMAKQCIPTLWDEHIECISESDAVAFLYLSAIDGGNNQELATDGNVLIYDMGAGTLDITYFSSEIDRQNRRVIEIKGKMGLNKAGNYIDYVIAQIIAELCFEKDIKDSNGMSYDNLVSLVGNDNTDINSRSVLKNYVKNKVKPILGGEDVNIPECEGLAGIEAIKVSEILEHDIFKKLLDEISVEVFKNCRSLFGEDGRFPIDLIIFSGRMTSMKPIRERVKRAARELGNTEVSCCDISQIVEGNMRSVNSSLLKTAVVKGALSYVEGKGEYANNRQIRRPKPFYAMYYIMLEHNNGTYEPVCCVTNSVEGYCATKDVDFTTVIKMYLVQTYASRDNLIDDFRGNRDYTTILDTQSGANYMSRMTIGVSVDTSTLQVSFRIGQGQRTQYSHDNVLSQAFRKSAWPILF